MSLVALRTARILLWLVSVDMFFLCLVLLFHPHSEFPAIGLIGALFFYPTNMLVGLLPYPWYYTPLFKGPRSPVGLIVALFSIQFLIMSVVIFPLVTLKDWLSAKQRRTKMRGT